MKETKKKLRKLKAFAVLQDQGDGWLPVAITFKSQSLLMENIPRAPTKIVDCTITFRP